MDDKNEAQSRSEVFIALYDAENDPSIGEETIEHIKQLKDTADTFTYRMQVAISSGLTSAATSVISVGAAAVGVIGWARNGFNL